MTDKLSEYGWGFQVKVIAAMFTDRLFLQQIADIIQPDYFESDANVWLLEIVLKHFREYKCPPSKDVLKATTSAVVNGICQYCNTKGITWEGVYDGDSCIGISNNAALKLSASGSCPK
jgi:hypothetical protein